jgi:hypothetical protein
MAVDAMTLAPQSKCRPRSVPPSTIDMREFARRSPEARRLILDLLRKEIAKREEKGEN